MKAYKIIVVGLFMLNIWHAQAQNFGAKTLSVVEFKAKLDSLPDAVLLDVRTQTEFKQGSIQNAVNIDFFGEDFENKIKPLFRDKVYLVYCASGARSNETIELMNGLGFKSVYQLEGGFTAWKKKKMPVSSHKNN
jgi:rhodanese-related sulfurtransferase